MPIRRITKMTWDDTRLGLIGSWGRAYWDMNMISHQPCFRESTRISQKGHTPRTAAAYTRSCPQTPSPVTHAPVLSIYLLRRSLERKPGTTFPDFQGAKLQIKMKKVGNGHDDLLIVFAGRKVQVQEGVLVGF